MENTSFSFFFCMSIPFPLPTFVNSAYSDFHAMDVVLGCDNLQCMSVDKPKTNKGNSGCRRREFSSLNFHFLKSLPEQVVMAMEFDCIEKQTLVTRELMCMVRRCSESGGSSFAHLQRQITDFHFDNFIRMKTDYLHRFNVWKSGVTALLDSSQLRIPEPFGEMEQRKGFNFSPIHPKTLRHLYTLDFQNREKYLNGAMVTYGMGYGQHATLMNSHKMILSFVLVNDDSTDQLEDLIEAIAKRYEDAQQPPPHTIYQDKECCSGIRETGSSVHVVDERSPPQHTHRRETKMLKLYRRLNPFIVLKLDIFHWMRRLLRGITNEKHAFVPGFFREIRLAVFVLFKEDFDRLIQAIMTFRKCDNARAEGLVTREEVCRFVQKNVPRPHILRRRLELVYENYRGATENDVPLFNSDMQDVWDQCMVHVDNDCLSDPPNNCGMYY